MKKIIYTILFFSVFSLTAKAQTETTAQNILNNTALKVQSSKGLSFDFLLVQKDKANHIIASSKGILKIKGLEYYVKQGKNEIFCNGDQIWNFDGTSVIISKANDDVDALSPQQIITGFSQRDFTVKMLPSTATNYILQLLPVDNRKNYKQVVLNINKSANLITKAAVTDKTNAVTEITFTNVSLNTSFPESQFNYNPLKHPGIEVINE